MSRDSGADRWAAMHRCTTAADASTAADHWLAVAAPWVGKIENCRPDFLHDCFFANAGPGYELEGLCSCTTIRNLNPKAL